MDLVSWKSKPYYFQQKKEYFHMKHTDTFSDKLKQGPYFFMTIETHKKQVWEEKILDHVATTSFSEYAGWV